MRTLIRNRCGTVAITGALLAGTVIATSACGAQHLRRGEQLFVDHCARCHTLAAAGAKGTIGLDLDTLFREWKRPAIAPVVRHQIATGGGAMPAGILTGKDAELVAAYVASAVR